MPRIHPRDIWQARAISKALLSLLPVCRDLSSARNELKWLRQHAVAVSQQTGYHNPDGLLTNLVARRARGEPLQYVLGSEFFGELEIRVRPGVLIPRPETASSTSYLASLISRSESSSHNGKALRVLDLCTGTGCIPLLFHHEYYTRNNDHLELVGVDISSDALRLARENLVHQIARQGKQQTSSKARIKSLQSIGYVQADILKDDVNALEVEDSSGPLPLMQALAHIDGEATPRFDIVISNPPYISPRQFRSTTARSVREYEPTMALVPIARKSDQLSDVDVDDLFYPRLLDIADRVQAKVLLFEVGDIEQAVRVATKTLERVSSNKVEIWRDEPEAASNGEVLTIDGHDVLLRGDGQPRSIFACRAGAENLLSL